jgi:hypothetical protein
VNYFLNRSVPGWQTQNLAKLRGQLGLPLDVVDGAAGNVVVDRFHTPL